MALPLTGLKVLDLSRLLPGPYATLVLADLGASIDKLEDPAGGDYARHTPPMKGDTSALFLGLNRNKRSLTLDLKSAAGVEALKRLCQRYDVVVETFRPGVMDKLGLGYQVLAALNPRLVYCAISGYGATGPDRLRAGHDLNYVARAGVLAYGGEPSGPPAMPGVQVGDIGGSVFAVAGILAALYERAQTGKGRFVDVSMTESAMAFLHMHLAARLLMGPQGAPLTRGVEPLNGGYACYGVFRTSDDKYLAVGALEPKFLTGLCDAMGCPEVVTSAYASGEEGARVRRRLQSIFESKTQAHWVTLFRPLDLCVEAVNEGDEVLADPQLEARGVFLRANDVVHLRTPLAMGTVSPRPAPSLGEHSREILSEAGFSAEDCDGLLGVSV